ncbi:hypothetical protein [Vibrio cholerae]|uniref:hypothetical protein n=1 Tax=Vibrio cholerae TaxID=666 RepID=UPI0022B0629E|nr:hypothetical protein [Vibrio cholerae]EGR4363266.1 hypothetical protein [Vibrio cholerae]
MENSENSETKKYAVDMMVEVVKQLITISTAFIVITASFIEFIVPDFKNISTLNTCFIAMSWFLSVLSILLGIVALGGISYSAYEKNEYDISSNSIKYPMCFQQILFVLAIVFFVIFVCLTM